MQHRGPADGFAICHGQKGALASKMPAISHSKNNSMATEVRSRRRDLVDNGESSSFFFSIPKGTYLGYFKVQG